jgi:hypothetical protein
MQLTLTLTTEPDWIAIENERLAALRRRDRLERMAADEYYNNRKALAESWAAEIRQAFLQQRPCPIKPEPQYRWVLEWAFTLAQMTPENLQGESL